MVFGKAFRGCYSPSVEEDWIEEVFGGILWRVTSLSSLFEDVSKCMGGGLQIV
jgi:hypothetical protein